MRPTGIVLAGGRSSRFGTSKLDAVLDGQTVLDRSIAALAEVCGEVLVVGRDGSRAGVRFVPDPRPFEGPLAGLAAGLDVATAELVVVIGGDMPRVRSEVLNLLLQALAASPDAAAAALEERGESRPLPVALRAVAARAAVSRALVSTAPRDRSLRGLIAASGLVIVPELAWRAVDPEGDSLLDIDVPADLEAARRKRA